MYNYKEVYYNVYHTLFKTFSKYSATYTAMEKLKPVGGSSFFFTQNMLQFTFRVFEN